MPTDQLQRRTFVKMIAAAAAGAAMAPAWGAATSLPAHAVRVEDLNLHLITQGWGKPRKDQSVGGNPIKIGGKRFARGIGTHVQSLFFIHLHGDARAFSSWVGVDDEAVGKKGVDACFELIADGRRIARSPILRAGDKPYHLKADLSGVKDLMMVVESRGGGINWGHVDWAEPLIFLKADSQHMPLAAVYKAPMDVPEIASGDPDTPEIHGPRVVGCTPGKPFMYKVPATGRSTLRFTASGLPDGLSMTHDGLITGRVRQAGEHKVKVHVQNSLGTATRTLKIIAGHDKLARTPQMGWNSWNAYGMSNTAAKTRAAADAMVRTGLAAKGFMYINIDDGWQNGRTESGEIKTTDAFGKMKDLADYVHSRGLRFGVYSSPGPKTCGGHTGSYKHVDQDAKTYAQWGVDFLKYDWCSYGGVATGTGVERFRLPYAQMGEALRKTDRDIFFSLCQYGMGDVWKWAAEKPVVGNSWRICGDIVDSWQSVSNNGFEADRRLSQYAGPGGWNDPDMLVVGYLYAEQGKLHWTRLTPNEQLSHITLWCMAAAPLLIGCDLEKLDKFTTDLLTNTEVLAVDQDELGRQAAPVWKQDYLEAWARPLWDGTYAVALFNRGFMPAPITVHWEMLKALGHGKTLRGKQPVRDLWKRKDLGDMEAFTAVVPVHGTVMVKVGTPESSE